MKATITMVIALVVVGLIYWFVVSNEDSISSSSQPVVPASTGASLPSASENSAEGYAKATFAGGCFWCLEPPYDKLPGVISTVSGYAGGDVKDPTYRAVSSGRTGHTEVVQITYDPTQISYAELLDVFWKNIDPTTPNRQFCDAGSQYRTAIFSHDQAQLQLAGNSKNEINASEVLPGPVVTEIEALDVFYPAEDYHQDYYLKNPLRYKFYRTSCGRDARLAELWGNEQGKTG